MKENKTIHPFKFKILNMGDSCIIDGLIPKDCTFNTFKYNLNALSILHKNIENLSESGFQSLVEAIIMFYKEVVGISEYRPTNSTTHPYKVHGIGKRCDSVVTIFCAFNSKEFLTDGNSKITEYFAQSCYEKGFDPFPITPSTEKIFNIFTDAKNLHENTKKNFVDLDNTQIYGIEEIKNIIDGKIEFWDFYRKSLENAKNEVAPIKNNFVLDKDGKEDVKKLKDAGEGSHQCIGPCGIGKFELELELSILMIQEAMPKNPCPVAVFASPRIQLGKQEIERTIDRLRQYGIKNCTIVNMSCEGYDKDGAETKGFPAERIIDTTSVEKIKSVIKNAIGPVLIFPTYNSAPKLIDAEIGGLILNLDEAHKLVNGKSIPENRRNLVSEKARSLFPTRVSYTATQELNGTPDMPVLDGDGMDNETTFGKVVVKRTPKWAIEAGKIVRPRGVRFIVTKAVIGKQVDIKNATDKEIRENAELNSYIIWNAFRELEAQNKIDSYCSDMNGIKMVVKMTGGPRYKDALIAKEFIKNMEERKDVRVMAISSDTYNNGVWIDGKRVHGNTCKNDCIKEAENSSLSDKMIFLNIMMADEGLNIPGFNAFLPFAEMSPTTRTQASGRTLRVHPYDRPRLEKGIIVPSDWDKGKFFKPCGYICIPRYEGFSDINKDAIEKMIEQMVTNYDYSPYEIFVGGDKVIGPKRIELPSPNGDKKEYFMDGATYEVEIIRSMEERKRQEEFRKQVDSEKEALRKEFAL